MIDEQVRFVERYNHLNKDAGVFVMPRVLAQPQGTGVQAAILVLDILDYIARQPGSVGVSAVARALGMPKSRIYRHLRTLVDEGYLAQSATFDKYRIGRRLTQLGQIISQRFDLASLAHDALVATRDALGQSVVLSELEPSGMRVLMTMIGNSPIEIGVKRGSLLGFHSTAQGKVALAFGPQALRETVFQGPLQSLTSVTVTSVDVLRLQLEQIKTKGWATSFSETLTGTNALAAPVFDAGSELVGTVAIVDSVQFLEAEPTTRQIELITGAAKRISRELGHVQNE